jgi:glucose/arabinose dehydrogenase
MKLFAAATLAISMLAAPALAAEPDGLTLPPGFHASVVADGLMGMRHLAVRSNGDIYISTRPPRGQPGQGVIALRLNKDGTVAEKQSFGVGAEGGTGIRISRNSLYATSVTGVSRFDFVGNALVPTPAAQLAIDGIPPGGQLNRMLAFDDKGALYLSVSGSGNICVDPNAPKDQKPVGLNPCPGVNGRGGIWRFDPNKLGQKFPADGVQVATGIRDMDALDFRRGDALYGVMHGRNGTAATWPDLVSAADDDNVAEEMHRVGANANFGWPTTYYDIDRQIRLVAPEYGGDGKTPTKDAGFEAPLLAFPGHSAPLDMVFYTGKQFPARYRDGAFIAFHGGGTKGHGFNVVFAPFEKGKPSGYAPFADGFAGATKTPAGAVFRPVGLALAPDGSLYIADDKKGRLWKISYTGK